MASYDLTGSVSEQEKSFIETWENVGSSVNYIIRENRRGDAEHAEIKGQRQFKLSSYDRMLTEDQILDLRNNPFKNGSFRPVIVPENVNIESNPNAMSEEDIRSLFKASDTAWDEWMDMIDSPSTLQRMIDMADDGECDLSHRRYQQLNSMHSRNSMVGKQAIVQKDQDQYEKLGGSQTAPPPQAVTPVKRTAGRPPRVAR